MSVTRNLVVLVAAAAIALIAAPPRVEAQCPVEPEFALGIYQDGVLVGEVFRDADPPDPDADPPDADPLEPDRYVEHWVLYPGYVYPTVASGVRTMILPGIKRYNGLRDFFEHVPFDKGSRYVKVDCTDGTTLPGR